MAIALAGALFSAQAGAMSSQGGTFDDVFSPLDDSMVAADAGGAFILSQPQLVGVAADDGAVTLYEFTPFGLPAMYEQAYIAPSDIATSDVVAVFDADGSTWAYVPADMASFDTAYVMDDASEVPVYVASYVSPPVYTLTFEE